MLAPVIAGEINALSAFTTDKDNQEFELKFTAPAGLLLNVPEPIANGSSTDRVSESR